MTSTVFSSANAVGVRAPVRSTRLAVRCQAAQQPDSRRQVLGLGMLLAASWVAPAIAETLAKPSETGGERVKAPKSAPTASATTTKPQPTSNPVDGQGLIAKLKAQSDANKEINDRKRLATSYANFESSRTVADGTCTFPQNLFGCDNRAVAGKVKYIADDIDIECQGKTDGKCGSKMQSSAIPKAFK